MQSTTNPPFAPCGGLRVRHEAAELAFVTLAVVDEIPLGMCSLYADPMRRAAASVHANLAEGEGRPTTRDRLRFFTVAWASLRELEAHAELAIAAGAIATPQAAALRHHSRQVGRMLHALCRALRAQSMP